MRTKKFMAGITPMLCTMSIPQKIPFLKQKKLLVLQKRVSILEMPIFQKVVTIFILASAKTMGIITGARLLDRS